MAPLAQTAPPGIVESTSRPVPEDDDLIDPLVSNDPWETWGPAQQTPMPRTSNNRGLNMPQSWNGANADAPAKMGSNGQPFNAWKVDKKVSKEVRVWDGMGPTYRTWHNRLRDHLVRGHPGYSALIKMIEAETTPLTMVRLQNGAAGIDGDLVYIASQMWGIMGDYMVDPLYDRRIQLASGEDENGVELWRRFWRDHEGGAEQVRTAGVQNLHSFPPCTSVAGLTNWLGEWNTCRLTHGTFLPDEHLRVMLIGLLPNSVSDEIRRRVELCTLQKVLDHLWSDAARLNDSRLASMHHQRLKQSLSQGSK